MSTSGRGGRPAATSQRTILIVSTTALAAVASAGTAALLGSGSDGRLARTAGSLVLPQPQSGGPVVVDRVPGQWGVPSTPHGTPPGPRATAGGSAVRVPGRPSVVAPGQPVTLRTQVRPVPRPATPQAAPVPAPSSGSSTPPDPPASDPTGECQPPPGAASPPPRPDTLVPVASPVLDPVIGIPITGDDVPLGGSAEPALAQPTLAQPTIAQPALAQPTLAPPTATRPTLVQPIGTSAADSPAPHAKHAAKHSKAAGRPAPASRAPRAGRHDRPTAGRPAPHDPTAHTKGGRHDPQPAARHAARPGDGSTHAGSEHSGRPTAPHQSAPAAGHRAAHGHGGPRTPHAR